MITFYCPVCWKEFHEDLGRCPQCGADIYEFWNSRDFVEKLILALEHPEPTTPIRTAWLLGRIKDPRAVNALKRLAKKSRDVYIARAALEALGQMDEPDIRAFIRTFLTHPSVVIRKEVERILSKNNTGGE